MIDNKHNPWLLEVNASPSFETDSSLDYKIKKNVLGDAFRMLNMGYAKRERMKRERKEQIETRIRTGKTGRLPPHEKAE
jgi:hypothetical protein